MYMYVCIYICSHLCFLPTQPSSGVARDSTSSETPMELDFIRRTAPTNIYLYIHIYMYVYTYIYRLTKSPLCPPLSRVNPKLDSLRCSALTNIYAYTYVCIHTHMYIYVITSVSSCVAFCTAHFWRREGFNLL